ncbi:MAG: Amuc_1100 family pilus-like protein [Candidatus Aureabacteria bacterium]|nr:Amuc_1100 family pilus-like protein [Candidatus Auribacterota bacterium]
MIEIKKDVTLYVTLGVLCVVMIVFLFILKGAISARSDKEDELQQKITEYKVLLRSPDNLSVATVSALKKQEKRLKEIRDRVVGLLSNGIDMTKTEFLEPIRFKDALLSYETRLVNRATAKGVDLPKNLGFEEYEGVTLPKKDDIPLLMQQMDIIEELVNLFVGTKVNKVSKIIRKETKVVQCKLIEDLCGELNFEIEMECTTDSLIRFMAGLESQKYFLIIDDMSVTSDKTNSVTIYLKAINFNKIKEQNETT